MFGRLKSELSLVIHSVADHIIRHFSHLLSNLNLPMLSQQNLTQFSQALQNKGCPLPNCWGFIDGTVLPICRPKSHQRELLSGHKRNHCIKFQSVYCSNGLIVHLDGPFVGRHHFAGIFQESGLLDQLIGKVNANGNAMYLYGDPANPLSPQSIVPFRGVNVSPNNMTLIGL